MDTQQLHVKALKTREKANNIYVGVNLLLVFMRLKHESRKTSRNIPQIFQTILAKIDVRFYQIGIFSLPALSLLKHYI